MTAKQRGIHKPHFLWFLPMKDLRFFLFYLYKMFSKERVSKLNSERLGKLAPNFAAKVSRIIALAESEGFTLLISQGLRTVAEQDALYAQGRTRKGKIVTNARGGSSNHNYGLAADFCFITKGEADWTDKLYKKIGVWAKTVGVDWGGAWRTITDLPHVEVKNLPNWRELLAVRNQGALAAVWNQFDK